MVPIYFLFYHPRTFLADPNPLQYKQSSRFSGTPRLVSLSGERQTYNRAGDRLYQPMTLVVVYWFAVPYCWNAPAPAGSAIEGEVLRRDRVGRPARCGLGDGVGTRPVAEMAASSALTSAAPSTANPAARPTASGPGEGESATSTVDQRLLGRVVGVTSSAAVAGRGCGLGAMTGGSARAGARLPGVPGRLLRASSETVARLRRSTPVSVVVARAPDGTALFAPRGELGLEADGERVICHLCGRAYHDLAASHVYRAHGLDPHAYRVLAGLSPRHALQSPARSYCHAARLRAGSAGDPRIGSAMAGERRWHAPVSCSTAPSSCFPSARPPSSASAR